MENFQKKISGYSSKILIPLGGRAGADSKFASLVETMEYKKACNLGKRECFRKQLRSVLLFT